MRTAAAAKLSPSLYVYLSSTNTLGNNNEHRTTTRWPWKHSDWLCVLRVLSLSYWGYNYTCSVRTLPPPTYTHTTSVTQYVTTAAGVPVKRRHPSTDAAAVLLVDTQSPVRRPCLVSLCRHVDECLCVDDTTLSRCIMSAVSSMHKEHWAAYTGYVLSGSRTHFADDITPSVYDVCVYNSLMSLCSNE